MTRASASSCKSSMSTSSTRRPAASGSSSRSQSAPATKVGRPTLAIDAGSTTLTLPPAPPHSPVRGRHQEGRAVGPRRRRRPADDRVADRDGPAQGPGRRRPRRARGAAQHRLCAHALLCSPGLSCARADLLPSCPAHPGPRLRPGAGRRRQAGQPVRARVDAHDGGAQRSDERVPAVDELQTPMQRGGSRDDLHVRVLDRASCGTRARDGVGRGHI